MLGLGFVALFIKPQKAMGGYIKKPLPKKEDIGFIVPSEMINPNYTISVSACNSNYMTYVDAQTGKIIDYKTKVKEYVNNALSKYGSS